MFSWFGYQKLFNSSPAKWKEDQVIHPVNMNVWRQNWLKCFKMYNLQKD